MTSLSLQDIILLIINRSIWYISDSVISRYWPCHWCDGTTGSNQVLQRTSLLPKVNPTIRKKSIFEFI